MALPLINTYKKTIVFPVTGKEYEIRPYLVGEEKALLIAAEGKDPVESRNAIKNLIKSCVTEKIDINQLNSTEMEFLFLEIRKLSADQKITVSLEHSCGQTNQVNIDLNDIKLSEGTSSTIILDEQKKIGVKMRIPSIETIEKIEGKTNFERAFNLIVSSIESIFTEEEVYLAKDSTRAELSAWVDNLSDIQLKKLSDYLENSPKLILNVNYTCSGCGEDHSEVIEGLTNFLL